MLPSYFLTITTYPISSSFVESLTAQALEKLTTLAGYAMVADVGGFLTGACRVVLIDQDNLELLDDSQQFQVLATF